MATSSHNQPLLNLSQGTQRATHKTILIFLSIVAFCSLSYLGYHLIQTPQPNSSLTYLSLCEKSHDPTSCLDLIAEATATTLDPHEPSSLSDGSGLLLEILSRHVSHIERAIEATENEMVVMKKSHNGLRTIQAAGALADCLELMDLSRDRVANSIQELSKNNLNYHKNKDDITTWLSAILTNHVTCSDSLQEHYVKISSPHEMSSLKSTIEGLITKARALLAIHTKVSSQPSNVALKHLLETSRSHRAYPSWLSRFDRKLLEVSAKAIKADAVVAKDGSGKFKTVAEAVASAPDKGGKRYVIYVKKGVYKENVEVGKKKTNVMIVGDGVGATVLTGSLNVVDGSTTFKSATLAAVGDGFILQDITIRNTAGPEKHQAVALRVGADKSVVNRCELDAFQDTLYTHSLRQFYRDSSIIGTVDFIFGNAAVVFQKCKLIARKPMASQKNMVTAQGRTDPNQNTGTSIQYCDVIASGDLAPVQAQFPTYLGRPWKEYSRTVYMQSNIGNHIDPKGWSEWDGTFALNTLYYGEYMNKGPGSGTSKRVTWKGYHIITDPKVAKQFTVGDFIQGQMWLDSSVVTYVVGL